MKKLFIIIFGISISVFLIYPNFMQAQNPQYILNATNFNFFTNKIEFDIYLSHTNPPVAFEYAGGQYYFNFNPEIANGGTLTYTIIESDLPVPMRPRGPAVYNSQLRLAFNTFPGAGLGFIMTNNGSPGTKIVKMRLQTSVAALSNVPFNIEWRNPPVPPQTNPVTKIFAYIGTVNTEITTPGNHLIGGMHSAPEIVSPMNNSTDNQLSLKIIWRKVQNATSYRVQVSTDSLFGSYIINDSVYSDTSKNLSNLTHLTKYYFRVKAMNSTASTPYTATWNFKTRDIIKLKLTVIVEGLYNQLFNLLTRKDTVRVYLRSTSPPYNIIDSSKGRIDSINFSNVYNFQYAPGGSYYIVARHFNSLEIWSKDNGQNLITTDTNYYNFTTAASQAYGDNLKLKGTKWTTYSADVNQDGGIDGTDLAKIHNDANSFLTGFYLPSDLDGNSFVDGIDFLIGDNNRTFHFVITP